MYETFTPEVLYDEDGSPRSLRLTMNRSMKRSKNSTRNVTLSWDNFESAIVAFLSALTVVNDDEEATIKDLDFDDFGNTVHITLNVRKTEKQLPLPFGDPLGR